MRTALWFFLWVTLAQGAAAPSEIRVFALGDRRAEVAPCGCPRVQLGGLTRQTALLDEKNQAGDAFLLDTGNTFFSLATLPESRHASESKKAQLIADAYKLFGVDVLVPGPRDLAMGLDSLRALAARAGVKLVATNLEGDDGQPLFATSQIVQRKGVRLGVVSCVDSQLAYPIGKVVQPLDPLKKAIADLKAAKVDAVALIVQERGDVESLRSLPVDIVVVPPTEEGKSVGLLTWNPKTRQTAWREFDLDPAWQKKNRLDARYEKYLAEVRDLAVDKSTVFTVKPKGSFVAQYGVCKQCHAKQVAFWEGTKHASAYLVLYAKNQHFNPECIGCHSLGYGEEAGFTDITMPLRREAEMGREAGETPFVETLMAQIFEGQNGKPLDSRTDPERYKVLKKRYHEKITGLQNAGQLADLHMGVQCEHCHGKRDGHPGPTFARVGKVKKAACLQCHVAPFDPTFDFKKRIAAVSCPRGTPAQPAKTAAPRLSK